MRLVIPYCANDSHQALRLVKWLGFLSSRYANSMLEEKCLLVVAPRAAKYARHNEICWLAARVFGEATCYVTETEQERGWPGSANFMHAQALNHIALHFQDDMFWLEPDAVPITPNWYDQIQAEWKIARGRGKHFMGNLVPHSVDHMTGIGVYGSDWQTVAPDLTGSPDNDAFDTWSAPQVLPHCHVTPLIQHVFRRHDPGWAPPGLNILDRRAVVFHQDKVGKLIRLLDEHSYQKECADHPLFSYLTNSKDEKVMRKFYHAVNVTRAIKSHGKRFLFDALDVHGGSVPGVYSTDVEAEQVALSDLTANPTTGVKEITTEEWERITKKKAPAPLPSSTSETLRNPSPPQTAILQTPSQSPAVLVAEPGMGGGKQPMTGPSAPIKDIADVIKLDTVVPAQSSHIGVKLPRPNKKKNFNINRETKENT